MNVPRERFGAGGGGGGGEGTHCTTCARVAAKRGRGGEGGHAYIYPKMNILTYACHLSPRDIGGGDGEGGWLGAPYAPRERFGAGGGGGGEGNWDDRHPGMHESAASTERPKWAWRRWAWWRS
jgi:hypothetical protein